MKTGTLTQEIENWLRQRKGECLCSQCVAKQIGEANAKAAVNRAVAQLTVGRSHEFSRYRARCADCGAASLVIRASPNFAWA
jgi:Zn finger protein HypA/HybF involved in hydrogenase expression